MAEITAAMIKDLRERTGAGMSDCKKALIETDARHGEGRRVPAQEGPRRRRQEGGPHRHRRRWSLRTSTTAASACCSRSTARPTSSPRPTTSRRFVKDVSMHIAGASPVPLYVSEAEIDPRPSRKEREIRVEAARNPKQVPGEKLKVIPEAMIPRSSRASSPSGRRTSACSTRSATITCCSPPQDPTRSACAAISTFTARTWPPSGAWRLRAGDRRTFACTWYPSHQLPPRALDCDVELDRAERWWRRWSGRCRYEGPYRDAVVQSLIVLKALTYGPTGGIVAAPDHVAARMARRDAQLGLPLLLGARRDADPLRADDRRLSPRGARLARLAAARGRGRPRADADHVRRRGRAAPPRVEADWLAGLRGLAAGADRQRRARAAAARRLRRGGRRALRRAPVRHRPRRVGLEAGEGAAGSPGAALAGARRRHLGGARAAPAVHALEGDGLGGVRSGGEVGRAASASRGPVDRWRALRDGSTPTSARGFDAERNAFIAVVTARRSWTRAC